MDNVHIVLIVSESPPPLQVPPFPSYRIILARSSPSKDCRWLASRPGPLRAVPGSRIYYEGKRGECGACRRWRSRRVVPVFGFLGPLIHVARSRPRHPAAPDREALAFGVCHSICFNWSLRPGAVEYYQLLTRVRWFSLIHGRRGNTSNQLKKQKMNQIQTLIDAVRKAITSNSPHDTILAAGIAAIPVLIVCLIINRLRHPDRSFLAAVGVSLLGFFLVPTVSGGAALLWVRTGGAGGQAIGVGIVLHILRFWVFSRWLRSAPRSARRPGRLPATRMNSRSFGMKLHGFGSNG